MMMVRPQRALAMLVALALLASITFFSTSTVAQEKQAAAKPDLRGFRTVETAITARISKSIPTRTAKQPAYLGLYAITKNGSLVVAEVDSGSPAEKAGLKARDILLQIDKDKDVTSADLRDAIRSKSPGDKLVLLIRRQGKTQKLTVALTKTSRPFTLRSTGGGRFGNRGYMGITTQDDAKVVGVLIASVTRNSPAAKSGLKAGDLITKLDGAVIRNRTELTRFLGGKRPGNSITVAVTREKKALKIKLTLGSVGGFGGRRPGSFDFRRMRRLWTKNSYRLAVIPVEFSDIKQNKKITPKHWQEALFSRSTYNKTSVTGQRVYGSLHDYYLEQSYGHVKVSGKVFDFVNVGKKREYYGSTNRARRQTFFNDALGALTKREGKNALKDFDGIFFLYAGTRARRVAKGTLFWPHKSFLRYGGKSWSYFICPEGGNRMESISVMAHEFGHMLGLPDLYPQQNNPEGLGRWCTMSIGHGRTGKPLHFSAWCKEQLGWIKPTVVHPRTKQKLILSPVMKSKREVYKVLVRPDGSEYLLLENRVAKGFDRDLPGQGLLIWRVSKGRPVLMESHGITNSRGPSVFLDAVPYPSKANNSFTPFTTPSSRSPDGGGLAIHINRIQKLADGRVTFYIGYEFY